jgi:hypothetical protein
VLANLAFRVVTAATEWSALAALAGVVCALVAYGAGRASRASAIAVGGVVLSLVLVTGCGGDGDRPEQPAGRTEQRTEPDRSGAPQPPDAGTRAGHGADRALVEVPYADATPPMATIALVLPDGRTAAEAFRPGTAPAEPVALAQPRLRGTIIGVDEDSGAVRVRVSVKESITCRASGGETEVRPKLRYFPPSQIERATAAPGARIPALETRSRLVRIGRGRCPAGTVATAVNGELWGDVTNGLGLEAVTPHIHFEWRR